MDTQRAADATTTPSASRMCLYDLEFHRCNGHPSSAVFTVLGQSLCVNCFVDTLNDGERFNARKTHEVRQLLGILQTSGQAFVHDLVSSQAPLLARGLIDALATCNVPSLSTALIGVCQLLSQATNYAMEIFFERLIFLLATALDPQNVESADLQGMLSLLAWFLNERYPSLEGVDDVGPLICIVQHLILLLERDLEENTLHAAIRILSRACLHPILFNQAKPVGLALLKNISQLTMDRTSQMHQGLCLELLQNCIRSGFLPSILSDSLQSDPCGLNKTLQQLCQGLKTLLLRSSEQIQIEACQIVSCLTCMSADATLREMMSGELCEHLFECLRYVEAWKNVQNKETMELHCLEALKELSCAGSSFDEHFVYGRSVIIKVAGDSISNGNRLLAALALEILHRAFIYPETNPTIDILDSRDLIEALIGVFPEYEDHPEKIDFSEERQKQHCLACDLLGWVCNNSTEHWDTLNSDLTRAFSRSMSGWSMMKNDALDKCFASGCRFFRSYCENLTKESNSESDGLLKDVTYLLHLIDIHAIPALMSVVAEDSASSQELCLAFESLSFLFCEALDQDEDIEPEVLTFCEKLMSLQWIQFSFNILSNDPEAEILRKVVWGLLVEILHAIDGLDGNTENTFDCRENDIVSGMNTMCSIDCVVEAIGEGIDGSSELIWETAIHVIYVCCLHDDYFFEPESLMEALCRAITKQEHHMQRNDVVFKLLRVYAETETFLIQSGCQQNQQASQFLIDILSKHPTVSISTRDPAARWILDNSNDLSRRMLNFWLSQVDDTDACEEIRYLGRIAFVLRKVPERVGILIETLQEMQGELCEKNAARILEVSNMLGVLQEISSRLLMGGLWPAIRRLFVEMDASPRSGEDLFRACIACIVQCVATSPIEASQLDECRDILQTSLKKFRSYQCEDVPLAALYMMNLVNVVVHKTAGVSSLDGAVGCEKMVERLFDDLARYGDFTDLVRSVLQDSSRWSSEQDALTVASLQHVLLAAICGVNVNCYLESSVLIECGFSLRGLSRCLAIRCLAAMIAQVVDWASEGNAAMMKGAIALIENGLWDEMPPVRKASIQAFETILEAERIIQNQKAIHWTTSFWYPMIFEEMLTCLATNRVDFSTNQTNFPDPLLSSSQSSGDSSNDQLDDDRVVEIDWDVNSCARCVKAVLDIGSCQDWLAKSIRNAVDEQRLFQTLLCPERQTSPDVIELVIALVKSGHVDFALTRIYDALKGAADCEAYQTDGDFTCGQQEGETMPFDTNQESPSQEWRFSHGVFVLDVAVTSPRKKGGRILSIQDALTEVERRRGPNATGMN